MQDTMMTKTRGPKQRSPLRLFLLVSIAIWLLQGLGAAFWIHAQTSDKNQWMLIDAERGRDFTIFAEQFAHLHTPQFFMTSMGWPFTYPATAAVLFAMFYRNFSSPYVVFQVISVAVGVIGAAWFGTALVRRGIPAIKAYAFVGMTLLMSYPFWFEWQRGNIEIILWMIGALGVAAFWRRWYLIAAVLIGLDAAAKLYPFMLLGLLVSQRKYWQAAAGAAVAVAVNSLSLLYLGPTYAMANQGIKDGLTFFQRMYLLRTQGFGFDHSLLSLIKCLTFQPGIDPGHRYQILLTAYMVTVASGALVLYFWKIRRLPRINQIVALVVISITIPPISYDYTLIHLYTAWAVMVLYVWSEKSNTSAVRWMFGLFAFVMCSEGSLYFMNQRIAPQLKCLALIALLVIALRTPFLEAEQRNEEASIRSLD